MSVGLPTGWENQILVAIQAPTIPGNVQALDDWQAAEGGSTANSADWNPMNTKMPEAGSVGYNSRQPGTGYSEVQAYPNWAEGLEATVSTIKGGNMSSILQALRSGQGEGAVSQAVLSSPWGTRHWPTGASSPGGGATGGAGSGDPGTAATGATPVSLVSSLTGDLAGTLREAFTRLLEVVFGLALVYLGLKMLGPALVGVARGGGNPL